MDYWKKIDQNPYEDLYWNIPERPEGKINIIGGNSKSFNTEARIAEKLNSAYHFQKLNIVLPDALEKALPPLDNLVFLSSTDSGSFKDADELLKTIDDADYNLVLGDLSKNQITNQAFIYTCEKANKPTLLTRDTIDLICEKAERLLMNENLVFFASVPQLKKLFQSVYYPKMILLTMSTMQLTEALHKFTLSYPASLITFHNGQIIVAQNGEVYSIPLENTPYSPITLWTGQLAGNIAAMNLFMPNNFIKATIAAIFKN
ncbi:hypothetical protein J6T21_01135 [Candidatus Saccharibacteria bacterium]|nr:hypothetical protein [Candidatus Saccharibacteria bacterium]